MSKTCRAVHIFFDAKKTATRFEKPKQSKGFGRN
jgi:hypothetical protein